MRARSLTLLALLGAAACGGDTPPPPPPIDGATTADGAAPVDGTPDDADRMRPDADRMRPDADRMRPDAGREGDGVRCGDAVCAPGLVCCLAPVGPTIMPRCQLPTDSCDVPGSSVYACDGPEDCGGLDCCETSSGSSCVSAGTTCSGASLCNSPDDCDTGEMCCPPGGPTTPWTYDRCLATPVCPL